MTTLMSLIRRTRRVGMPVVWLALFAGCSAAPKPAEEKPPPATVKWEEPSLNHLEEWMELIGTTVPAPDRVARVTAPVEGRVVSVFGDGNAIIEGARVGKGTPLVQLDATVVQAALAKAEATQDVLREEETQARFAVELATSEIERLKQLAREAEKLVTAVDRLKADYALKDAQSKLNAARGRLIAGDKEQQSLKAQAQLHTLTAPIAGRVGRAQVVRGQTLAVGTLVTEVLDLEAAIDVVCFLPPSLLGSLTLGMSAITGGYDRDPAAEATVDAEGQVVYIADQAEPETGNFAVKLRFNNADAHLRANRVQRVRVLTKPGKECLSLRESAVQSDEETPTVVIVTDLKTGPNADGKEETTGIARRLKVVLGMRARTLHQVEIVSLDDPEKDPAKRWTGEVKSALFIVEGGQGLQTGDAVKLEVEGE